MNIRKTYLGSVFMVDKKKVSYMVKLAIYDKHYLEKDRKILEYFRHDYVYKQNTWTRFFVVLGTIILLIVDYGSKLFLNSMDVFSLSFENEIRSMIVFILVLLGIYTVIGTVKYNAEFTKAEQRAKKYQSLVSKLEKIDIEKSEAKGERS